MFSDILFKSFLNDFLFLSMIFFDYLYYNEPPSIQENIQIICLRCNTQYLNICDALTMISKYYIYVTQRQYYCWMIPAAILSKIYIEKYNNIINVNCCMYIVLNMRNLK